MYLCSILTGISQHGFLSSRLLLKASGAARHWQCATWRLCLSWVSFSSYHVTTWTSCRCPACVSPMASMKQRHPHPPSTLLLEMTSDAPITADSHHIAQNGNGDGTGHVAGSEVQEGPNPPPEIAPPQDPKLPARKDTSLRELLNKIDDYAPIVSARYSAHMHV